MLQRSLETFAKPLFQARSMRVFRDDSNLAANPDLWGAVQEALDKSEFLILLASPESAGSEWVEREVLRFVSHRPRRWAVVLTAGTLPWIDELGEAVLDTEACAISRTVYQALSATGEPLVVDIRAQRDTGRRSRPYVSSVASLAAFILGRDKDAVYGEHLDRQRQFILLLGSLLLAAVAGGAIAVNRQQLAVRRQHETAAALDDANRSLADALALRARESAAQGDVPGAILFLSNASARQLTPRVQAQTLALAPPPLLYHTRLGTPGARYTALAGAPGGHLLAAAGASGVQLVDPARARVLRTLAGAPGTITALAFDSGGRWVAAGSSTRPAVLQPGASGTHVTLWSVERSVPVRRFDAEGIFAGVRSVSFSSDGRLVAAAVDVGRVVVWDAASGKEQKRLEADCATVRFHPLRPDLLACGSPLAVHLFGLRTGEHRAQALERPQGPFGRGFRTGLAFSGDGSVLLAGSTSGTTHEFQLPSLTPAGKLRGHATQVTALAVDASGVVASAAADGMLRLAELRTGAVRAALPVAEAEVAEVVPIAGGFAVRELADAQSGPVRLWTVPPQSSLPAVPAGSQATGLAFSPDGEWLALSYVRMPQLMSRPGPPEGALQIYGMGSPLPRVTLPALGAAVFSPGWRSVFAAGADARVHHWSLPDGRELPQPAPRTVASGSIALSPDGSILAVATTRAGTPAEPGELPRGRVELRPRPGKGAAAVIDGPESLVVSMSFSPDGKWLAAATLTGQVWVWALPSRTPHRVSVPPVGAPATVAFDPSGEWLLVTSLADVYLARPPAWRPVRWPHVHENLIAAASISPGGRLVATSGFDGRVVLWDAAGEPLESFQTGQVHALAFSPDGERLVVGTPHGLEVRGGSVPGTPGVAERMTLRELRSMQLERVGDARERALLREYPGLPDLGRDSAAASFWHAWEQGGLHPAFAESDRGDALSEWLRAHPRHPLAATGESRLRALRN